MNDPIYEAIAACLREHGLNSRVDSFYGGSITVWLGAYQLTLMIIDGALVIGQPPFYSHPLTDPLVFTKIVNKAKFILTSMENTKFNGSINV